MGMLRCEHDRASDEDDVSNLRRDSRPPSGPLGSCVLPPQLDGGRTIALQVKLRLMNGDRVAWYTLLDEVAR